ncbi:hypothetical protein LEN26_005416 [Aphanomyces euteiches]|nr:hypothetical protein AeMF1_000240 [Aphanomyces euteiches]KAH9138101.1 hypothetical protein LEN26_005416 [Aphanomyces euteiches]KAH9197347.1 hypothetical protein AeNC1_000692 [Aphanomyces euteiches]
MVKRTSLVYLSAVIFFTSPFVPKLSVSSLPLNMNILIVEADAWFEGHRRVRVPKGASMEQLYRAFYEQLNVQPQSSHLELTMFDPTTQSIVPLVHQDQIQSHARVFVQDHSAQQPILAIASRSFDYAFDKGEFKVLDKPLYIQEVGNTGKGTGLTIWDGSVVLAKYLESTSNPSHNVQGKRVLELGAGTGLVGLAAAFCGASEVTITDLAYTLENVDANIRANAEALSTSVVSTHELDWFAKDIPDSLRVQTVDILVGSDIVWVEDLIPPLVDSIAKLLNHPPAQRLMLLAHQTRSTKSDTLFFDLLIQHDLVADEIVAPEVVTDKIRLYQITTKNA